MAFVSHNSYPTIGVLSGWQFYWTATSLSYLEPVYRGIRKAARDAGCNLLLGCGIGLSASPADPPRPAWPVPMDDADFIPIGIFNTDGLIVVNPLHSPERSRYVQALQQAGHPVLFVGAGEAGPTISTDNAGGIDQALRHLLAHGHTHIAFIAGSPSDMSGDTGDRLRAYWQGVERYRLAADERLVAFGMHTYGPGYVAMQKILTSKAPFTAVLASNDESAMGAMQALQEAGLRIPDDVAMIGFDNRLECGVQNPPLTSVHVPLFSIGYQAAQLMLAHLTQGAPLPIRHLVPTRLAIRASCGCRSHAVSERPAASLRTIDPQNGRQASGQDLAHAMTVAVMAEAHGMNEADILSLCQRLLHAFRTACDAEDEAPLGAVLHDMIERAANARDDVHCWQAALTVLRHAWEQEEHMPRQRLRLLDGARTIISAAMRDQHQRLLVAQRRLEDRVGILSAGLLSALDEQQIISLLAKELPAIGIHYAWLGRLPAALDGESSLTVQSLVDPDAAPIATSATHLPLPHTVPPDRPFTLALIPLIGLHQGRGFVAFEANKLDVLGGIARQISNALNTAQLYRDATEGRRLAEEANQLKSRFLSTVSHELRTPLNLIVGLSNLVLKESNAPGSQTPPQLKRDVSRIYANARHLGRLIEDVLDLASSEAGQLRLSFDYVDLVAVLHTAAETGRRLATEKGLAWRQSLPDHSVWVWGDRTRLQQVALNLIANAVKFTPHGSVSLALECEGDNVIVKVKDTGIGLTPDEQQLIFDDFQRTERSARQGFAGIGLGLAISKRLIELHHGVISVSSSGIPGAGSEFRFTLPRLREAMPFPTASSTISPEHLQRVLVLAAGQAASNLSQQLAQRNIDSHILPMNDRGAWQAQLRRDRYDAIILDASAGEGELWHTFRILKSNPYAQQVPVLFYAADAGGSSNVLEFDYLTKPIQPEQLRRSLENVMGADLQGPGGNTFLVVDDDPDILDLHKRIIESQHPANRVLTASNGVAALEILRTQSVSLVLLDLIMPGLDGFAVLEAMQADSQLRRIPVIVITGKALNEADMARLNSGVAKVIQKGLFNLAETLEHVEAVLSRQKKLSSEAQRIVRKAMVYMHEHYAESISRQDLARHVGMSEDYLTYCFRLEVGMTPVAYLNRYRIAQAKTLLSSTNKSITDIALDVGFASSAYFSRIFKRETSLSPSAYRKQAVK